MILNDVVATVSTKSRTNTTLPLVITSLICSNYKPYKLVIYDDNDEMIDPRENEIYKNLLEGLVRVGIMWYWIPGQRRGQIHNHEHARLNEEAEYIWRIDDDNILPANVLQTLYNTIKTDSKIGAVGPSILDPKNVFNTRIASNKIEDVFLGVNVQWNLVDTLSVVEVEHLQGSNFLYRKKAAEHGYNLQLSRVGHREETLFTYEMHRNGWKLYAVCGLNTWHMRYGAGGIRSHNEKVFFDNDEKIFYKKLKEWKVKTNNYKFIYLDSGRGDHYAFKRVLPDIAKKHADKKIYIGACFKDAFWDTSIENVTILDMNDIKGHIDPEQHNIYKFMAERKFKDGLSEAYKKMYL